MRAARLLGTGDSPLLDVAMYHCEQAAEKALNGFLVFFDEKVAEIHDVGLLLEQAAKIEPGFNSWHDMADRLTPLATLYRYPTSTEDPLERSSRKLSTTPTRSFGRSSPSCPRTSNRKTREINRPMSTFVGIDLGTTNSVVAHRNATAGRR